MFDMIIGRHLNASMIVLVNDPYDLDISMKDSEHIKRATDKGYIGGSQNIFIRSMERLHGSKDFNKFFRNPQNKIRPTKVFERSIFILLTVITSHSLFIACKNTVGIFLLETKCMNLSVPKWKQVQ